MNVIPAQAGIQVKHVSAQFELGFPPARYAYALANLNWVSSPVKYPTAAPDLSL